MSEAWPVVDGPIRKLNIMYSVYNTVDIRADGSLVYSGSSMAVVNKWQSYFDERTLWSEIVKRERRA